MASLLICPKSSDVIFCARRHNGKLTAHPDSLCPENYPELKTVPTCDQCFGLLERAIPNASTGNCTRQHESKHWDRTPHAERWCPEMVSSYFCKC